MKKYFQDKSENIIEIEISEADSLNEIHTKLKKYLSLDDDVEILVLQDKDRVTAEYIINSNAGSSPINPLSIIALNKNLRAEDKSHIINTNQHYRVWFSNNPNVFLPTFERITIEESLRLNPDCQTTLIVDKSVLATSTQEQLTEWAALTNCKIVDLSEIEPKTLLDKIILAIVKKEVASWIECQAGNPGLASDLIRLVLVNQGTYLDCDCFTFEGLPKEVTSAQGGFTNFMYIQHNTLNNDILAFSSEAGNVIIEKLKEYILKRYFGIEIPSEENLAKILDSIMMERNNKLKSLDIKGQIDFFERLVTNTTGPWALNDFFYTYYPEFNNLDSEIIHFLHSVKRNAKDEFLKQKQQNLTMLSWLPGSQSNGENDKFSEDFRNYLKKINDEELIRRHQIDSVSSQNQRLESSSQPEIQELKRNNEQIKPDVTPQNKILSTVSDGLSPKNADEVSEKKQEELIPKFNDSWRENIATAMQTAISNMGSLLASNKIYKKNIMISLQTQFLLLAQNPTKTDEAIIKILQNFWQVIAQPRVGGLNLFPATYGFTHSALAFKKYINEQSPELKNYMNYIIKSPIIESTKKGFTSTPK